MLLGYTLTKVFKLPSWVTPAISFNNSIALPLLLISSLQETGILKELLMSETDNPSDALLRAKSYFLVNAMVADSITFALGPKLLDGEEAPHKKANSADGTRDDDNDGTSNSDGHHQERSEHGIESANGDGPAQAQHPDPDEQTSLLPNFIVHSGEAASRTVSRTSSKGWAHLPVPLQRALSFLALFLHAPLLGAATGAILGLVPPLHKAFFGNPQDGGIFTAWLTDSVKKIGELFPALQIVVVGVKLSSSMRKMKRGEESGSVPWPCLILITAIRFVVWPAISISVIYALASRTTLLARDPMLWFVMMLMPTGPTAMKLTAMADVSGSGEREKLSIAKFLSVTYAMSPLICFAVVGSLKACKAAAEDR